MIVRRLVIAVDCDDVLVESIPLIVKNYNKKYQTTVTEESFYDPENIWNAASKEDAIQRVNTIMRQTITHNLIPSAKTIGAIKLLAKVHELHLITGRQDFMTAETQSMVERYFPGCFKSIEHTNFVASSDSKARRRTKGEVCSQIKANVLIDDHLHHGRDVLNHGVERVIVFGSYPWNQDDDLPSGMTRCTNWAQTVKVIDGIAKS